MYAVRLTEINYQSHGLIYIVSIWIEKKTSYTLEPNVALIEFNCDTNYIAREILSIDMSL